MLNHQKVCVILPAFNAEKTLAQTVAEIPRELVDDIILVDDASRDNTVLIARRLGLHVIVHEKNRGYGGNQKTCYAEALARGADIVVMVHPDYQYTPRLIPALASTISTGLYDICLGSRILGKGALSGGMPIYKYISNRVLTLIQNILLEHKLSEYHTGFRAFSRRVLENLNLEANSDDFIFDNQVLAQAIFHGYQICEVSCPTRYTPESSSISMRRSVRYGFGVLATSIRFRLEKWKIFSSPIFASARGWNIPQDASGVPLPHPEHFRTVSQASK